MTDGMKPFPNQEEEREGRTYTHVFRIEICLMKISDKNEKKYRDMKMNEIMRNVCALWNSNGGKLHLHHEEEPVDKRVKDCIRMIEQRVQELTTCLTVSDLTMLSSSKKLTFVLRPTDSLVTLNYNLYLPSESQIMELPSSEPTENVKRILQKRVSVNHALENYLRVSHFVRGSSQESMRESKFVAFKLLKDDSSKCVTIADRMVGKSNKFTHYVSAFANHSGGYIFYGIQDDGTVRGQRIDEREKHEIVKKVTKAVKKMVWPVESGGPEKGKHWDIVFKPVVDINGYTIPSTYVIAIYVAFCPGGVFAEEPESYHVKNKCVEKMPFHQWMAQISAGSVHVPRSIPRIQWSSARNRRIYIELTTRLVEYRNNNMVEQFQKLGKYVQEKFPASSASLVVLSEKVALALKQHQFMKATSLISEFEEVLKTSADYEIFEVRRLYLKSRRERAKCQYQKSYETAKEGIQKMQLIPPEFITVWFYMHAATLAIILSSSEKGFHLQEEAKAFLELAARDANSLDDLPEKVLDLQQKLHIYRACLYLGCSLTGEILDENFVSTSDMKEATSALASVHRSILSARLPTNFRQIQFLLAQCDLFYRYSQLSTLREDRLKNLKCAFKLGGEAQSLARECHFEEMVHYANKRIAHLTEKLILQSIPRYRLSSQNDCILKDFESCIEKMSSKTIEVTQHFDD